YQLARFKAVESLGGSQVDSAAGDQWAGKNTVAEIARREDLRLRAGFEHCQRPAAASRVDLAVASRRRSVVVAFTPRSRLLDQLAPLGIEQRENPAVLDQKDLPPIDQGTGHVGQSALVLPDDFGRSAAAGRPQRDKRVLRQLEQARVFVPFRLIQGLIAIQV